MKNLFLVNYILITVLLVGCYVGKSVYVGAEKDGEPHGQGTMTWNYGEYDGEWKDGEQHGHGTLYYSNGSIMYVGEWKNGNQHGQGTYNDLVGGKYVGKWGNGVKLGQGTYTYHIGGKYVGEWKGDKHGQGTYTYPDGHTFIGQWVKGKKHGQGAMYWGPPHDEQKKPYKTLEGEWRKGKRKNVTHFDLNGKIIGWFYIPICETVSIKNGKLTLEKVGGDDVWAQSKCESSLSWQKFENRKKGLSPVEETYYVPEIYKNNKWEWFPISGGYGHCNEPLVE